jgi:precorrin isomerase
MSIHPIERESYRILADRIDLSSLGSGPRAVVERVIHATADLDYARTLQVSEVAVAAGIEALRQEAPIIVDVEMVGAGITARPTVCRLAEAVAGPDGYPTRSAMAMRLAATQYPRGAVFVIGCAPTAVTELLALAAAGLVDPALVIAVPVGFVGAADAKACAHRSALATITNTGDKGGSAVAAAVVNALVRLSNRPRASDGHRD